MSFIYSNDLSYKMIIEFSIFQNRSKSKEIHQKFETSLPKGWIEGSFMGKGWVGKKYLLFFGHLPSF